VLDLLPINIKVHPISYACAKQSQEIVSVIISLHTLIYTNKRRGLVWPMYRIICLSVEK